MPLNTTDGELLWAGRSREMSLSGKVDYVLESILPMLTNDLRAVVESGCPKHGNALAGPNFTVALLCMIACETVGALAAPPRVRGGDATRAFIAHVGTVSGDSRYRELGGLLFTLFRHGIGHSFLPKQHQYLAANAIWMSQCIDDLAGPSGAVAADLHRKMFHLTIGRDRERQTFGVVTKILYLDVCKAIEEFGTRLRQGSNGTLAAFESAFNDWVNANERVKPSSILTELELSLLEGRAGASNIIPSE